MKLKALKIASLLLFASIISFGQTSVPNTETFSLQDVYNAVHAHTGGTATSLQSCFDNAISSYFNPMYNQDSYAPANSMLRFRDYKPSGCSLPTVTTTNITNILDISASGGGNVTSDGGCTVTARGICWSTSHTPSISDSKTTDGNGTGSFASSLINLTCGVTYYVRAYATNSQGTSYGDEVSFTTTGVNLPEILVITGFVSTGCGTRTTYGSSSDADYVCAYYHEGIDGGTCNITSLLGQALRSLTSTYSIGDIIYNYSGCGRWGNNWFLIYQGGVYYKMHTDSLGVIDYKSQCYP